MTTDLACLVINALWAVLLVMLEVTAKTRVAGLAWNAGNREEAPAFPPWIDRTSRAIANHKENFPLFLTAVLVVHVAGRADRTSAACAIAYVVARCLHAILYILGVKGLRSLAFVAGLLATLGILSRLVA